jgi:hypothetical protein
VVTGVIAWASWSSDAGAADAGTRTLIDYFLPTPIICPLTSSTWGAASVLPRDVCNGMEDSTGTQWQYWDGKILEGADGKFHMYAGRWPQNKGFADWPQSVIVEGVSNGTDIGSYIPVTTTPFTGKEQNVTGITLNSGGFALIDSPGNIYTATVIGGPWTSAGAITISANGFTVASQTTENQTIWQSADNSFLIVARNFQEMTSPTNIVGPYTIEATIPNLQNEGYEDPVVWCSGGQYHLVANMYNARKAYHFTSTDGIHNWVNQGLAYDPTSDFVRYTDGTVNHWYKAERPGVFMQNGHVVAFSFAVIDVDKTLDLANDNHGSKVIVVPFDGVTFDQENPGPGSAACPKDAISPAVDAGNGNPDGGVDAGEKPDASQPQDATTSGGGPVDDAASSQDSSSGSFDAQGGSQGTGGSAEEGGGEGGGTSGARPDGGAGAPSHAGASGGCACQAGGDRGGEGALGLALITGSVLAGRRRRAGAARR